jgi:phosphatidylserine/phosphatidylglycerophosphate/cardiolipin synthase-like enzyme
MTKYILPLILLFSFTQLSFSQIAGYPDFEIVESIPVETVLDNPSIRNTQEVWLEMINSAKKSLDIEEFYVSVQKGEPLEDIIAAIISAAERGVQVRLLADARMYKTYPETIDTLGKLKNISTRVIDFGKLAVGVQHSKFFIVDGEQIFLGSQNFDWRALKHIHELGVRVKNDAAVKTFLDVFNLDWNLSEKNDRAMIATMLEKKQYTVPLHVVEGENDTLTFTPTYSPKGLISDSTLWDETHIVSIIDGAKSDVMCQFLTYSSISRGEGYYPILDAALKRASNRGVKVKMIVSDWSIGHPIIDSLKSLAKTPNIEIKFSAIPEWSGGYVSFARVEHCKYLVADTSRCWIGTSNWEKSYFYNTRNLGLDVQNAKITVILQSIFLKGWDGPYTTLIKQDVEYTARKHGEKQ